MRERVPSACGEAAPPVAPSAREMRNRGADAGLGAGGRARGGPVRVPSRVSSPPFPPPRQWMPPFGGRGQ